MGMCKACKEVFNANDMVDGYCKSCVTPEIIQLSEISKTQYEEENFFSWWRAYGWLILILGNIVAVVLYLDMAFLLVLLNSILGYYILKYNKYAFLIATILTLNPLIWILNGIYLKNRWNHPRVNKNNIELVR